MTGMRKMKRWKEFIKRETVLSAAIVLALVSVVLVRPDWEYLAYIDYRTIGLLFCLMTVMAGLNRLGVFRSAGEMLLGRVSGTGPVAAVLVYLCFFFSMLITNDVALITFVPFGITVLKMAGLEQMVVPVVLLQTVAANLGSMMTPVGNPQNLYLYSCAGIPLPEFLRLMVPYTAVSFGLLGVCLVVIGKRGGKAPRTAEDGRGGKASGWTAEDGKGGNTPSQTAPKQMAPVIPFFTYLFLFTLSMACVAHILPWQLLLGTVAAVVYVMDRSLFLAVDYSLLATFGAFFIFIGNMGRVPAFCAMLDRVLKDREIITSVLASQIISNVPAALLLSGFTDQWEALLIGTNLGGLGTLIASMASLISYKHIAKLYPGQRGRYLGWFTVVNLGFLAVLLVVALYCG